MIASFTSFHHANISQPYEAAQQGLRTLKQLDGTPGDKNPNPNAISMTTSQGQLDAVILSNPDDSSSIIQRLSKKSGEVVTSWLDIPKAGNGIPNMTGFEISQSLIGLHGLALSVKESWNASSMGIPSRSYENLLMASNESQNALMRAEAVLASFPAP
ncbi:MAG: hypothetical protein J0I12_25445 [Candidatus Eremiobacteraeota bacterium]|nr:hypothetical protein [Candidatus Eremiobacteraeota bacterium]